MDWELDPLNPEIESGDDGDENVVVSGLSPRQVSLGQWGLFPRKPWVAGAGSDETAC